MTTEIGLGTAEVETLRRQYPSLQYVPEQQTLVGEIDFRSCYDSDSQKIAIEGIRRDTRIRSASNYIADVFEIEIRLDADSVEMQGWPRVYEVGGRAKAIAEKLEIREIDLHLFEDGALCLGLRNCRPRRLKVQQFVVELVVPALYRLAYVDRFGLEATQRDLWGEYSHGRAGVDEYERELDEYGANPVGRNDSCPCGSGSKGKSCHWDEIEARKRGDSLMGSVSDAA